jgi:hypothetical protein
LDETLIVDGDFSQESGRAAVRTLLDERGVRFQAVVCSNDRMAFGVLEVLEQRGIKVPDSVAVTGFDDINEAQSMGVPLTTVRQPFYEAGTQAFEALLKKMGGAAVEPVNLLSANLVIRWSCGCMPESIKQAVVLSKEVAHTGRLENKRDAAVRALFGAAGIAEDDAFAPQYHDVFGRSWDIFLSSLNETEKNDSFLKMVQAFIEVMQKHGMYFPHFVNMRWEAFQAPPHDCARRIYFSRRACWLGNYPNGRRRIAACRSSSRKNCSATLVFPWRLP